MPSSTAAELERTWSRLYVAIFSIQHQVELQRGPENAPMMSSFNVPLSNHLEIVEGLTMFYSNFVEDYKENRTDSATFEFFTKFGILEETVQLAAKDIPQGLFDHVVSLLGAVIAHLPPDALLHERFSGAVKKLCRYFPMAADLIDRSSVMNFMEAMTAKLIQERNLSLIFADVKRPLLSTLRSLLRAPREEKIGNLLDSDLSSLLLDALLVLSDGYDSELETLFLELIFGLVDPLCNGPSAAFCAMFGYLGRCLGALKRCSGGRDEQEESTESALCFIDLYRGNFVDRIFGRLLLSATKSGDNSMEELLGKILDLLEKDDASDLLVILMGKTTRVLDKSHLDVASTSKWPLVHLYNHILGSCRLQSCLAFCSPVIWKESSMAHRHRLEQLFSLVWKAARPILKEDCNQATLISGLYKWHLGIVESTLPSGYAFEVGGSQRQSIPKPRETFLVLDQGKNQMLWTLYDSSKNEVAGFWGQPTLTKRLALCQLIMQVLCLFDTIALYTEYGGDQDEESSLLQILSKLLKEVPETKDSISIEFLLTKHQHSDVFDQNTWRPSSKDPSHINSVVSGTYLLMHVLLRMAAIIQARAIRPPVKIYYE